MKAEPRASLTIEAFEEARIEPAQFNHEAHVYIAWLYVGRYPNQESIVRFDAALRRLTRQFGQPAKYHATITWLFLLLIRERFQVGESWGDFKTRNLDLVGDASLILARYYTQERLASEEARERFLLPDRLAA